NYIRLSDGGPRRHEGPKSEVEVIATLAHQVSERRNAGGDNTANLAAVDWQAMRDTGRIREAIARIVPGMEQIEQIGTTKKEFQIVGRTMREPRFPTADGRANIHTHALPPLQGESEGLLRLMTI